MFRNESKYQGELGEIKYSQAFEKFHFKGRTTGIALKYVKEGHESYLINGEVIEVQKGQFILLSDNTPYEAKAKLKAQKIDGLCIDLNPALLELDLSPIYENQLLFNLPFDCSHTSKLGHTLSHLNLSHLEGHDLLNLLGNHLHTFSTSLHKLQSSIATQTLKIETQRHLLPRLIAAKNYVHQHYSAKINLDLLAKLFGISKYHFVRLFKRCFQQSPLALQESLRMQVAIKLINHQQKNFSAIAYDLGYTDLATFSRKFKKHYGLSPSQYLKSIN